jgi:hypothetical protein
MDEFLKCECWYCGRSIKYPSEGTGIEVLCPTCRKPVTLTPDGSTANFGSTVFPPAPAPAPIPQATSGKTWTYSDTTGFKSIEEKTTTDYFSKLEAQLAKTKAETITLKINAEDILLHKTGKREQSRLALVRNEPATEKQKEKLRWFGCTFNETLTKGQASDALDKCVRDFPARERDYYDRPATEEQRAALRAYYGKDLDDVDGAFIYGKAKNLLQDIEMEKRQKERAYELSQECYIAEMTELLNGCGVSPRKITQAEITKAWNLVVSRSADKSYWPGDYPIVGALAELFPDLESLREGY